MILLAFLDTKKHIKKGYHEELVDFHTYTGKDVYEYNSQTTIDIDSYSLNDNLNHFFNYSTDEFVKIAKNTQKEIVPVIMKDEMMVAFDDIQSFKDKIEQKNATQSPSNLPKVIWAGLVA